MKNIILFCLLTLLFACNKKVENNADTSKDTTQKITEKSASTDAEDYICVPYEKVGKIKATFSYADLEKIFGKKNVKIDTMIFDGEITGYFTLVQITPTQEVQVYWKEGLPPYKIIEMIKISEKSDKFKTKEGVGFGTPLADLVKANGGKPFKFAGFGWEHAGNCCQGTQKDFLGGISSLALRLPSDDYSVFSEKEKDQMLGDKLISSDLPIWKKTMPTVSEMYVYMNKKNK